MRFACRLLLFAVVCVATPWIACAQPAPGGAGEFTFPRFIAEDCDNLFVLGDPLPPLRRLLTSNEFRRFAKESQFARDLPDAGNALSQAPAQLEAVAGFVPAEIAIGFPSSTYDDLVTAAKLSLAVGLCSGATDAGEESIANELPKLQSVLLEAAREIKTPEMTVWVRFRDPHSAGAVFGMISGFAAQLVERPELEATVERNLVHLKFVLGDVMPAEALPAVLAEMGLAPTAEDPRLPEISAALAQFEAELWLERFEDGIRVSLGRRAPQNASYPVEALGPLWRANPPLLAFGKWRLQSLKSRVGTLKQIWEEWKDTAVGQAAQRHDEEDLLGSMKLVLEQIDSAAENGSVQVTARNALEGIMQEQGFRPVESLATSPLKNFLPRETEIVIADARKSLAHHLAKTLTDFEDRLDKQWLRAMLRGREDQVAMNDQVTEFYYGKLAPFRRMVFDDAGKVFHRPYAMLLGTRGTVDVFDLQFDDRDGNANRITVRGAPMIEYAAIGRLVDPSRPPTFPNELVRAFLGAFLEEVSEAAFAKSDVGLGVETMVLDVDMFERVPGNVSLTIQGDLQPHYFVVDGWIVCSTSLRLSKSILAAWRDPQQRFDAPVASGNDVTAFGQMPGDTFATFVEHAMKLVADTVSGQGSVELQGPTVEVARADAGPQAAEKLPNFGDFIRLLDRVEWRTTDRASVRETRFRIKLAGDLLRE